MDVPSTRRTEVAPEEAINIVHNLDVAMENVFVGDGKEEPPSSAPRWRIMYHGCMRVSAKKTCHRVKKHRLTSRASAPPLLPIPAAPLAQEEQAGRFEEEIEPRERIPVSLEEEDTAKPCNEMQFMPTPEQPYGGPEQYGFLVE
jgi:hypothetical protein